MDGTFHQNLSQLRKGKRVSQRKVASDLYISQALLSHYENGIREPGLDFVNRACSYYGVTADFLLGRTEVGVPESLSATDTEVGVQRLDTRALMALLQAVSQLEQEALVGSMLRCFGAVSYRLLRHMASADPDTAALFLTVPENRAAVLSDMELHLGEVQFLNALEQLAADQTPDEPRRLVPQQLEALLLSLDKQISLHSQSEELV